MAADVVPNLLYLDLLEKILTNTVFSSEPDPDDENRYDFIKGFTEHYVSGGALCMLPRVRLESLKTCILGVLCHRVPGDLLEAGVWRGGTTIFMRAALKACGVTDRLVWVCDSFEGLPEPDINRFPIESQSYNSPVVTKLYKRFAVDLDEVQRNFAAFDLLDDQFGFLKAGLKIHCRELQSTSWRSCVWMGITMYPRWTG